MQLKITKLKLGKTGSRGSNQEIFLFPDGEICSIFTLIQLKKYRILHECSCSIEFIKQVKEEIKYKACRAFYLFFSTSLINSIMLEHKCYRFYLSYDIKITLKSQFWRKNDIIFVTMYAMLL